PSTAATRPEDRRATTTFRKRRSAGNKEHKPLVDRPVRYSCFSLPAEPPHSQASQARPTPEPSPEAAGRLPSPGPPGQAPHHPADASTRDLHPYAGGHQ